MNETSPEQYEVTVREGTERFWFWRLSMNGETQSSGVRLSEQDARSDAATALEAYRQTLEDDQVMGTVLG